MKNNEITTQESTSHFLLVSLDGSTQHQVYQISGIWVIQIISVFCVTNKVV